MISAIILAAGASTRFGRCKQLMRLGDKTMLEHVLHTVSRSAVQDVILVLGAHAEAILHEVQTGGARVVINQAYAEGLSSSLQAGLRMLPTTAEAALIVLADQPFVSPRTLDTLIEEYRRHSPAAVIPVYHGARGNPVLVDRSIFAEIMRVRGDIGCRAIFGSHGENILKVAVDDPGIMRDIDSLEDFESTRESSRYPGRPNQDRGLRRDRPEHRGKDYA
ncbi:MAG: NTP transferase domain-containing protein [Candidatus Methylomirabilales bacterium]